MAEFNSSFPFGKNWWADGLYKNGYRAVADIVDDAWMLGAIKHFFKSQKRFAAFLGVKSPTVNNWFASKTFPEYAKRLLANTVMATYISKETEDKEAALERDISTNKDRLVVVDGNSFAVLDRASKNESRHKRKILASGISTFQNALDFAGAEESRALIRRFCADFVNFGTDLNNENLPDNFWAALEEDPRFDDDIIFLAVEVLKSILEDNITPHYDNFFEHRQRWTEPETLQKENDEDFPVPPDIKEISYSLKIDETLIGIEYPHIKKEEWRAAFSNACTAPLPPSRKGVNNA